MHPAVLRSFFCILSAACLLVTEARAQIWVPVTHASGSQVINGRTVTVTSSGSVRQEQTFQRCGAQPYTIGINYQGIPGDYTFSFSPAIATIQFRISATNLGEINSFYINGAHYLLTPANLSPLPACDTQYQLPLGIQAGDVIFPGPIQNTHAYFGRFGSGIVEITVPTGINSIRINNNGVEGGSTFGVSYWGFYAEASNNNPCRGDSLFLSGEPTDGRVSYFWTGPNGFTSANQHPAIPNSALAHDGIYTLRTVMGVDTAYDTTMVRTREVPLPPVITGDSLICYGATARFGGTSATSGVSYLWNGPNGFRNNTSNNMIRNARERDTGMYSLVAILNGCPSLPAMHRLQLRYPVRGDTTSASVCSGGSYVFHGRSLTAPGIYEHIFPGGSNGCDSLVFLSLTVDPPLADTTVIHICQGGSYSLHGTQITETGYYTDTIRHAGTCDSAIVRHLIFDAPQKDTVAAAICAGGSYPFFGKMLAHAGYYTDSAKTAGGCDSVSVLHLSFRQPPEVHITYDHNRELCMGDTVLLHASGATSYSWFPDDGRTGSGTAFSLPLSLPQNGVMLSGTNDSQCSDTALLTISAAPCCTLFVPNAFTPNGDGRNDRFRVQSATTLLQYRLRIFNRYGQLVFTGDNLGKSWDGLFHGTPAETGVYFYEVRGTCISGTEIRESGDLTLVR